MTIRGRAIILCVLMCSGRAIYAEDAPAPSLGTRARLTIAGDSERVVGTITSVDEQTLTIQPRAASQSWSPVKPSCGSRRARSPAGNTVERGLVSASAYPPVLGKSRCRVAAMMDVTATTFWSGVWWRLLQPS